MSGTVAERLSLVRPLLGWYRRHGRDLPWRRTRHPYRILLSEVMLQQTQAARVREAYGPFLRRFPTIARLAAAPLDDVLIAWRGMGYNNRAVRLHALARTLAERGGRIPRSLDDLLALPGIGRYTAHALLAFAFGRAVPVVDINVRRVLSRRLWTMRSVEALRPEREIWAAARSLVPARRAYDWNQALMDLGAMVCTARQPRCSECPLGPGCPSRGSMHRRAPAVPKREPTFGGIPRRIYRGRIVELLRDRPSGVTMATIGRRLDIPSSRAWLESVVGTLERDGLVRLEGGGRTRRARLAR